MAREFARRFYKSKAWKNAREYIFNKFHGLCEECGAPGEEVHHIEWLKPSNIDDTEITLGEDNLVLLCRNCHIAKHRKKETTNGGYKFNDDGELVPVQSPHQNILKGLSGDRRVGINFPPHRNFKNRGGLSWYLETNN